MSNRKIFIWRVFVCAAVISFAIASTALADNRGVNDTVPSASSKQTTFSSLRWWRQNVRCDKGRHLSSALRRARPGATLYVYGTCTESVVIRTDRLKLIGIGDATVDGGGGPSEAVIIVDGARGVRIEGIDVINGADQGVLISRQAQVSLDDMAISLNATVGLSVDRSDIDISDLVLTSNGTGGMDAYAGSNVLATGTIGAHDNGGDGIAVNGKSYLELRGAELSAQHNRGSGVSIINDSRLQIFSFPEAQGSSVTADGNGFAGIGLLGSELSVVGSQFFGSGANVIAARNNAVFGFFMPSGSIISPHATAKFVAEGNGVGMLMEDGASALVVGGLAISGNGAGISAIGAGTLTLVSVEPNPSTVTQNRIDIDLGFGTRLTINEVSVDTLACDETVLVRGTSGCPPLSRR